MAAFWRLEFAYSVTQKLPIATDWTVPKAGPQDFVKRSFQLEQEIVESTLAGNCIMSNRQADRLLPNLPILEPLLLLH
jgi:hypothetical protein